VAESFPQGSQLVVALGAPQARETDLRDTVVAEGEQGALDFRTPEALGPGEAVVVDLLEGLVVIPDELVQERLPRAQRE
jgi:hypothetical protein